MPILDHRARWAQQPGFDAHIEARYAPDLALAIDGADTGPPALRPYLPANNAAGYALVGTVGTGPSGIGFTGASGVSVSARTSALSPDELLQIPSGSDWTMQFVVDNIGIASGTNPGWFRVGSSSGGATFLVTDGATRRPWLRVGGVDVLRPGAGYQWTDGTTLNLIVRYRSASTTNIWVDGQQRYSAAHTTATPALSGVTNGIYTLLTNGGTENLRCNLAAFRAWRRYLSDADTAELAGDPWALYEPRRIWVPVTASGGGVTGSSSGTFALTGSAAGAVAIAGASSGAFSLSGTATGAVQAVGASSGTFALSGSATGAVGSNVVGASTGTFDLTGSAAGAVAVAGASSGTFALTGTATGTAAQPNTGASSATFALSGAATGTVAVAGASSGTFDLFAQGTGTNGDSQPVAGDPYGGGKPKKKREVRVIKDDREEREAEFAKLLAKVRGQAEEKAKAKAEKASEPVADIAPPRMPTVTGVPSEQLRQWMPDLLEAFRDHYRRTYMQAVRAEMARRDDEEVMLLMGFL